ncbi:MAG TPA: hypothetical protein VNK04_17330 [Gemmataceae bacterium]|nr:hypothetical protein [Gemmataceae bacterium]
MANQNRGKDESRTAGPEQTGTQGMMEKAKDVAAGAARSAGEAMAAAGRRAEDAAATVGSGMQQLAGTIRENAPREGMLGTASSAVARTLESSGRYLQEEGFRGMLDDLSGLIRRNPIPAVLIGIGIGFLLARTTSRS